MVIDDPLETGSLIPTFAQPPPRPAEEASPPLRLIPEEASPETTKGRRRRGAGGLFAGPTEPDDPRPDDQPTPTAISSVSKPTTAQTTALLVGVLGLAAVAGAAAVRWRFRRKLRQPTQTQSHDIAAPLASILLRHFDASWINKDLADVLAAGAATGAYLNDGPLLTPLAPDPGIPDNLQEYPQ